MWKCVCGPTKSCHRLATSTRMTSFFIVTFNGRYKYLVTPNDGTDCPCPGSDASQATFSVGDHLSGIEAGSRLEAPAPRKPGQLETSAHNTVVANNKVTIMFYLPVKVIAK